MDKQFFLNTGIPTQLQFDQPAMPTWHSLSAMEIQPSDLHFPAPAAQPPGCFFESALNSIVSSPVSASNSPIPNESFVIRELIGKLGNICNSGEITPPENIPAPVTGASSPYLSANNSCYSTPLSSPPKMNRAIMENFITHLGNSIPGPSVGPNLPAMPGDPGFMERATRFSSFGSRSFNGRTSQLVGQAGSEFPSKSTRLVEGGKLQRVSSSPSINGAHLAENGNSSPSPHCGNENERKTGGFSGNCGPVQGEFGNSREKSSVLEQTHAGGENGSRPGNDVNPSSRKRKSLHKGKCKEIPSPSHAKVVENGDDSNPKRSKLSDERNDAKAEQKSEERADDSKKQNGDNTNQKPPEPPKDYIHVRARRGQATDSHSLAERVRREKISERMKLLQDLVPGCNKVTGKALMLEEIINYVQSLQRQVEFLSMKLASVNPRLDFNTDNLFQKDIFQPNCSLQTHPNYPLDTLAPTLYGGHQHPSNPLQQNGITSSGMGPPCSNSMDPINQCHDMRLPAIDGFNNGVPELCEGDLHTIVQMGFGQNNTFQPQSLQGSNQIPAMKTEF